MTFSISITESGRSWSQAEIAALGVIFTDVPLDDLGEALRRAGYRVDLLSSVGDALYAVVARPVCSTCNDTHTMSLHGRDVMCTACPLPCQACRAGGNGPYCATTPCGCACHQGASDERTRRDSDAPTAPSECETCLDHGRLGFEDGHRKCLDCNGSGVAP